MINKWTPMLWPGVWKEPYAIGLLKGTAINCLLLNAGSDLGPVADQARQEGILVADAGSPPAGVTVAAGQWPGVKLTERGTLDQAAAGPTGVPWVDSNGWMIRLTAALHPGNEVWINATPPNPRPFTRSYLVGVADAAAHGGRWIISLDDSLAGGIIAGKAEALQTWKSVTDAAGFFAMRKDWSDYSPEAVVGIISDFAGPNEFLSHEILNLVARTNQQYRIILRTNIPGASFGGLRALMYTDDQPPPPELGKRILAFVQAGGMLITGPRWGPPPGTPVQGDEHPRYDLRLLGKGRLAICRTEFEDPYLIANDSQVLISRRYELLRFWNAGAVGSYFTLSPDRKHALVQLVSYARTIGDNRPSVRIVGRHRAARLYTLDQPSPRTVEMEIQQEAVELHLPPISEYAALELELQAGR